ncbi:hypothetical protein [Streptomyces virginiae]|uniref:hypothetical protein n=1 Tax=Streptomyces virginiae TaxID=1961 RepID=UPI002253ABE1|nr:hypothetical protein [Streptomyces virginiae]MCX4959228.1 hypothetical protein [Streptomyces virginiae]MCX5178043.1 hypothetical protein [Streptomyces virginiae]
METVVLIAVIILMIGVAMRWIHVLNARDDARIEAYRFSDPLPRPPGLPDDTGGRGHPTDADR